jgi:hypothetical protein
MISFMETSLVRGNPSAPVLRPRAATDSAHAGLTPNLYPAVCNLDIADNFRSKFFA